MNLEPGTPYIAFDGDRCSGATPSASGPACPSSPPSPTPSSNPSPPAGSSPYAPPGGSFSYPGSTQNSMPRNAAQPDSRVSAASVTNVSATRTVAAGDDRMPRPVDDAAADGSLAAQKPIVRTLQPRGAGDASNRPVDILDLPKTP